MRFSRWFTGRGDQGTTDLMGGKRVKKSNPIINALGNIDELSAHLGACRVALGTDHEYSKILHDRQKELISLMGCLISGYEFTGIKNISEIIDELTAKIEMPREFIIPGNNNAEVTVNIARTVCRRAERYAVIAKAGKDITSYLNRLSSLLFLLTVALKDYKD